jgi:hypothetical protein
MEWFAVSSAVTTSLAWAGADARARGAWVSLADVCRQTMTESRIRAARNQLSRVCRLARVGAGDLRAVINAGLVAYDGDDLVLAGWDLGKEREAARAAQRSREHRQRQQRQEVPDEADVVTNDITVLPDSVREPFAYAHPYANPYANPNFGTEERRVEKKRENTPPPSPQGVNSARTRTRDGEITATAATAQGELPGNDREPFANVNPNAPGILPGTVREPFANAYPNANPYAHPNAETTISDKSPVIPEKRPHQLAPKRSPRDALPALRSAAISDNALGVVTALGGCLRGPGAADYTAEWQRELTGTDAREVLAMCLTAREPIRLPSGLRREREAWRQLPIEERRRILHQVRSAPRTTSPSISGHQRRSNRHESY